MDPDLDLQFSIELTVFKEFMHGISKVRAKLSSVCIICSLGQVHYGYLLVLGQV